MAGGSLAERRDVHQDRRQTSAFDTVLTASK